jgi:serine protease Do
MKKTFQVLSIPLILVLLMLSLAPAAALERQTRLDVMLGVVQVSLVKIESGDVYYLPWGSGTIISADGLILTNCHVADPLRFGFPPDQVPDYNYLGIGLTVRSDQPPQLAYLAEVAQADPVLDLAVLRIVSKTDGTPVRPESLNLPYVERGDSDAIDVGDELNIFGYPGIGGETVTFTTGVVSGFSLDASIAGRAWIKTDASISGGNSGGTAVDVDGLLVGVPTRAGDIDCRPVKDTNGDGTIDTQDDCVPIGGFINALRPVKLADPLIQRATLNLPDPGEKSTAGGGQPTGQAKFSGLFFSPGLNEFNQPTSVISSLPSGARSLYLFFDYENLSQGATMEMKVFINGREVPDWGLPAGPWGGEEQGVWWIGWDDADFADGTYRLVLYVDGAEQAEAQIEIGGPVQNGPQFSNVVLSLDKTAAGAAGEPAVLFPAGIKTLYAFFDYQNMSSNLQWTRSWLVDGQVSVSKDEQWSGSRSGSYSLELDSQNGLAAGAYRVNLYIGGELAAMSNFWVTGSSGSSAAFDPITFAEGIDSQGNPVRPARSFASGLDELHAFSSYSGMEDGMSFAVNWTINGQKVIEDPYDWDGGKSGSWHYYVYSNSGSLPDGEYQVELTVEGQVLQQGSTVVGSGAPPSPQPTPVPQDGVRVEGTISDLDTGRPIAGATFLVLNPGITMNTFQWTEAEVYTSDDSDRNGFYQLPQLLSRGQCYSMIIGAQNYWTYGEDDVCIGQNTAPVVELPIKLEKK